MTVTEIGGDINTDFQSWCPGVGAGVGGHDIHRHNWCRHGNAFWHIASICKGVSHHWSSHRPSSSDTLDSGTPPQWIVCLVEAVLVEVEVAVVELVAVVA